MYLKSLTLKGFKSFAQPTTFQFEQGVTFIVGPNGSGKSNVVDALAWVMGEQGAKSLRGGKMEDVIFAGTATKGPLGRAEVTLTIDNSDGALPIDYTEVTVTRTLFRSGGSEYAINGESCRLLDVQDLLSDSGLGREMHVIVGQGQLDTVLHATPFDRRGFIEEAAGILKHRRRKEKTERKLESMQANLTRLSDLAGEIRRQLKPLGSQAKTARAAQTIQATARDARARLLADDVVALRTALAAFDRTGHERDEERIVLRARLDDVTRRAADLDAATTSTEVDEARAAAFALESVQERLRGLYTLAGQRLALLGSTDPGAAADPTVTPEMIAAARTEALQLSATIGVSEVALSRATADVALARRELDAVDEHIAEQAAALGRYDLALSRLQGQAQSAASRLAAVRGEGLRRENAVESARDRRAAAAARVEELATAVAEDESGEDLAGLQEQAQADAARLAQQVDELRERLHGEERERESLAARTSALSLALDTKDGSRALLDAGVPGLAGRLADGIAVEDGWEAAVAAALGSLADAVLADGPGSAATASAHALVADFGRVEIVLGDAGHDSPSDAARFGRAADSVVTGPAGIRALLSHTALVEDSPAALGAWAAARATRPPVTLVTRTGEVFAPQVLRAGAGGERSRIELVRERDLAAERLTAITRAAEETARELADARTEAAATTRTVAELAAEVRRAEKERGGRREAESRLRAALDAADADLARSTAALAQTAEQVAAAEQASAEAAAELAAAKEDPRPAFDGTLRVPLAAALEAAREREVAARLALETARERVRAENARIASLEQRREAELRAAEEAARRAVIRRRQVESATAVADALPAVLDSVGRSVAEARLRLAGAEAQRSSTNRELADLRRIEAELRARLHEISEDVHGLELQIYERRLQLSNLLERAGALGLDEAVLVREYGPGVPVPEIVEVATPLEEEAADDATEAAGDDQAPSVGRPYDRAEQQKRLEEAERRLGQLGRINPLALEEFAALEQRHTFLVDQLADLQRTRKDLLTIIGEIDERMQTIFTSAFEDTRAAFAEVFPVLFPGGSGSIELTDPNEPLTTGIEVAVRPAGKKIERLSLLSGGERSLAAVALLVAIFKARPSPFYIMDEVEAALDDANLGRLLTIFQDLRTSSQLIVITHQKRTMEIADALYGVSMRRDGVSAVVGQRVGREREAG